MRASVAARLAWSLWGAVVLLGAGLLVLVGLNAPHLPRHRADLPVFWMVALMAIAYAAMGALIVARRGNPIGWIFCTVGFALVFVFLTEQYAFRGLVVSPGGLPGSTLMVAASPLLFSAVATLGLLFLVFPTGRLPSIRWRPVVWALLGGAAMGGLAYGLRPGHVSGIWDEYGVRFDNPFGVPALAGVLEVVWQAGVGVALVASLASAVSLVLRFRRSTGEARQQIKWLVYVVGAAAVLFVTMMILGLFVGLETDSVLGDTLWIVFFTTLVVGIPASVALAILRYRLYDIDRIINRTLVYGALTVLLAAVYVGAVVGLGTLVGQSTLLVAASTLLVAALFRPARRRVQDLIDRRFYRRKYDAARTLEAFSARLRDEVDLDTLAVDLAGVVRDTMQPASVSLWLRPQEASP